MSQQTQPRVKVKTRLPARPFPPNSERPHIRTERLILSPFVLDDLDGIHALRRQPEVMIFTLTGRIDADKAETLTFMARFMAPNDADTYNYVIRLASTGEIIGAGGVLRHSNFFGWPEVGYMFKREHWGQGYASEFLKGYLDHWWALPRVEAEVEVDRDSAGEPGDVPEMLTAIVDDGNPGSKRVLEKAGFRVFRRWAEPDSREGFSGDVNLVGFVLSSTAKNN
ncbi:acyl-CoA N-acyltransferase [Durotheca rogersii]|uniref:acyl-CoA N-acyltransferase n=1 Tax=Durotheca rogersii TaxID=419775 RepID=UPI0022209BA5|nr:acyl-CoA N-acyltransferase [Durotheca rogersii]KAI5864930.1 acyl-CoA N-acyltransferase [Durotheca rogersii]